METSPASRQDDLNRGERAPLATPTHLEAAATRDIADAGNDNCR